MFNEQNAKYVALKGQLEFLKEFRKKPNYDSYVSHMNKNWFKDQFIINIGGIRQSGKTTSILKMFNPKTDIFSAWNIPCSKAILDDKLNMNNGDVIFSFDEYDKMIIQKRKCYGVITSKESRQRLIECLPKGEAVIYLDVESLSTSSSGDVNNFIDELYEYYNDDIRALCSKTIVLT